ncbi:MAG: acyl--CoA ligase, partial [bacterium]|nr:acyl--CoA ligase [bacterium]
MVLDRLMKKEKNSPNPRALIFNHNIFSSQQIDERVDTLYNMLAEQGVTEQHRIGLLAGNTPLFLCALLAVAKMGAGLVLFSAYFKKHELEDYIKETGISLVITDKKCSEIISGISFEKKQLHTESQHPMGPAQLWTLANPGNNPYPRQQPRKHEDRTFILQFTSGTGGKSKIVPRTYRNIAAEITGIIK